MLMLLWFTDPVFCYLGVPPRCFGAFTLPDLDKGTVRDGNLRELNDPVCRYMAVRFLINRSLSLVPCLLQSHLEAMQCANAHCSKEPNFNDGISLENLGGSTG